MRLHYNCNAFALVTQGLGQPGNVTIQSRVCREVTAPTHSPAQGMTPASGEDTNVGLPQLRIQLSTSFGDTPLRASYRTEHVQLRLRAGFSDARPLSVQYRFLNGPRC